jgi:predicted DNA-binding transcriptional regulator YafY
VKSERLIALLFTLQARRSATAAELAAVLEVSERTILRDVAALQTAGVPLWSEPGRGGGIRLLDGWRTRLDGLTAPEAAALFVSGVPTALADLGLAGALTSAQSKLFATLPETARQRAQDIGERFHLDAPGWFHREEKLPCLATVASAVWQQERLTVGYRLGFRRGEHLVRRVLDPLGLVLKAGVWYLVARVDVARVDVARVDVARVDVARVDDTAGLRSYRVSRIASAEPAGEAFDRPAGFNLAEYWAQATIDFDRSILRDRIRVRVPPHALRTLAGHTDRAALDEAVARAGPPDAEGWLDLDLAVESIQVALHQLLPLGDRVEVLDPPQLRAALAEIGEKVAARNKSTG